MKSNIIDYINKCESYKISIKNLHWSAENMSEHKLCDDIASSISDNEDAIAEAAQGLYGQIKKNELKPKTNKITTTKKMLQDLITDTQSFYKTIQDKKEIGIRSIVEAFIGELDKFVYLTTLCLKEDFKRKINDKLEEQEVRKLVRESITKILKEDNEILDINNKNTHEKYHLNNGFDIEIDLTDPTLTIFKNGHIEYEYTKQDALNKIEYLINLWNKKGGKFEDVLIKIFH